MKKNMGSFDRTLRIIIAIVLAILILLGQIEGIVAVILGIVAIIFVITGLIGFCPIYTLFKINTAKNNYRSSDNIAVLCLGDSKLTYIVTFAKEQNVINYNKSSGLLTLAMFDELT